MSTLPSAIAVSEPSGGEVLYRLPQRPLGLLRYIGLVPMSFGAFIASWPLLFTVFFLTVGNIKEGEARRFAVFGPLVCFGPICFPVGGFFLIKGLFYIAGRMEVALRADRLYIIDRCGPLRWTRRQPLDKLRGFRVEHGSALPPNGARAMVPEGMVARLIADLADGRSVTVCHGYPREWLLPLAEELARRCQQAASYGGLASTEPIAVAEDCADPTRIQERTRQPTNSNALVEQQPDGLTITIPPAGLLRGSNWIFILWCLVWNGFLVAFVPLFLPAAFRGEVKWEGGNEKVSALVACLFLVPFLLVGIGSVFVLLHRGRRQTRIAVAGESLQVVERGLFGTRRRQWSPRDLLGVRVLSESTDDDEGHKRWTVALLIQSKAGERNRLLSYRKKAELEWIAGVVRQSLGLREEQTQLASVPDEPIAVADVPVPAQPPTRTARLARLALPVLALLGAGVGWEIREGTTENGQTISLKNGIIFPWQDHPRAADVAERKQYVSIKIRRWYAYGSYRSSSSHGR